MRGKAIADYDLDIDYETEGSYPDIKAVEEDKENSDTEHANMELPQDETLHQRTTNPKVSERIKRIY